MESEQQKLRRMMIRNARDMKGLDKIKPQKALDQILSSPDLLETDEGYHAAMVMLKGYTPDEGMVLQVGEEAAMWLPDRKSNTVALRPTKSSYCSYFQTKGLIGACKHGDGHILLTAIKRPGDWSFHRHATAEDIAVFVACKLVDDGQYRETILGHVRLWKEPIVNKTGDWLK